MLNNTKCAIFSAIGTKYFQIDGIHSVKNTDSKSNIGLKIAIHLG